jgi:hypothetical protein
MLVMMKIAVMIPRIIAATPVMVPARYRRITAIARIILMTLSMVPIFLVIELSHSQ